MIQRILLTLCTGILLSSTLMAENNDVRNNAKLLTTGTHDLLIENNEDWFKINIFSGTLTLTMTPANGDINMILYNVKGQDVSSAFSQGKEVIHYKVVNSGTYYIKLNSMNGAPNYNLQIETSSNVAWEKTLDFGPIRDVSVALYDIDNDGKDEIFVATSKGLDNNLNEIRPAGLICLEDDGTVKWTRTFPAVSFKDTQTGKRYKTTSVTTTPFFSNIDDDPEMEILIGVGGDTIGEAGPLVVGQPGDKGGLYALEADGSIKWFHQSLDVIGGSANVGDKRPDGVYGSPIVYDIDNDGAREVIYNSWDQHVWILNASTGKVKRSMNMLDTIWSTPAIADINNDGKEEILVTADISQNAEVGTSATGGIFHVINSNGMQNIVGFNTPIAKPQYSELRGKFEDQALWSSPVVADIDKDGFLEIAYGTGNYFHDGRGEYIRVWNHDGSEKFKLPTIGRTFATPLIADINNDGKLDIIAATLEGYVYAWDNQGHTIFSTQIDSNPIFSSPIAIDTNNDGQLEIIYSSGAQITIIDNNGNRVNTPNAYVTQYYKGSPAVKDIDNDGVLDLISGGNDTNPANQAVVRRWVLSKNSTHAPAGKYQYIGSNTNVQAFVSRFYKVVLGRNADPAGLNDWTERLVTGAYAGADIARGFIFSDEYNEEAKDDVTYLTTLYKAFFNRDPDNVGLDGWLAELNAGKSRFDVLDGFLYSQEFTNLSKKYNIKPIKETNINGDIEAFVQRFYQEIFGRSADDAGLSDWVGRLASGESAGADIARGFIFSDEFIEKGTDNTNFVKTLYKAFFAREADPDGLKGWLNALNNGTSRNSILDGFLFSDEFSALSQAYGIVAVK